MSVCLEAADYEALEESLVARPAECLATYRQALRLHGEGYSLIPVSRRSKRPVVKWKCYQSARPTPGDLYEWFALAGHRIGIVTGRLSGIVVVDCDDLEAVDQLLDWAGEHDWPESLVKEHTTRGVHLFYRHPGFECRNRVRCLGARIDVRGDGGYVLVHDGGLDPDRAMMPAFVPLP